MGALSLTTAFACTKSDEVLVFAAASLSNALTEIGEKFEAESDVDVLFSFGGSQTLAQQINAGAPADIFISAGRSPADFLTERGLVLPVPVTILENRLVVVTRDDGVSIDSIEQLNNEDEFEKIAVADPKLAPAGEYARESLTNLGIWDGLQGRLIFGVDVRATLAYVETGSVSAALVYQTDALIADNLRVLDIVPPESYSKVTYPAMIVNRADRADAARVFIDFLQADTARAVFTRHGFTPLSN